MLPLIVFTITFECLFTHLIYKILGNTKSETTPHEFIWISRIFKTHLVYKTLFKRVCNITRKLKQSVSLKEKINILLFLYPTFSALLVNTKSEPRRLKGMYFLLLIWTIVVETCSSSSFDPKLFQKCSEIRESAPFEIIIEYLMDYFIPNIICFVILSWFKIFWRPIMLTTKLCKWLNKKSIH